MGLPWFYHWFTHQTQPFFPLPRLPPRPDHWAPRLRLLRALQKRHAATNGGGHQAAWGHDFGRWDDGDLMRFVHEVWWFSLKWQLWITMNSYDIWWWLIWWSLDETQLMIWWFDYLTFKSSARCTRSTRHFSEALWNSLEMSGDQVPLLWYAVGLWFTLSYLRTIEIQVLYSSYSSPSLLRLHNPWYPWLIMIHKLLKSHRFPFRQLAAHRSLPRSEGVERAALWPVFDPCLVNTPLCAFGLVLGLQCQDPKARDWKSASNCLTV